MTETLAIGKSSFLCRSLAERHTDRFQCVGWQDVMAKGIFSTASIVVNFAVDPRTWTQAYSPEADTDLRIATHLLREISAGRASARTRYVMLSSRKVYGPSPSSHREEGGCEPVDHYGRAKKTTEVALTRLLGDRLTVLRLSNVFGWEFEPTQPSRKTFFAQMLRRLHLEKKVVFDMSPFTARDFLPASCFAAALDKVLREPRAGIFNLGAGIPVPTGELALWTIKGYGTGELVVQNPDVRDSFCMDIGRFQRIWGDVAGYDDIRKMCVATGQRLRDA